MQISVSEFAKKHKVLPGQVLAVLNELGVEHDGSNFEAEGDELELIQGELASVSGTKTLRLQPGRTPRDIAQALGIKDVEVQKTLVSKLKKMLTITSTLEDEVAEKLVEALGYEVEWVAPEASGKPKTKASAPAGGAQLRSPVVTIMGHVDHGKTSLLDYIRKTNVVDKEAGGITQHIGAYQVTLPEGLITFLDTPGHAAFTAMRARGAQVTDIAILVVAADDGIMPQTIEAISHAKNAKVPIIIAVNKIDKPAANPDKVLQMLPAHELIPEAYGGDVATVNVSAITGEGVQDLLEQILLQAEIMELKADPKGDFRGVVIEAKLERGRGSVATVLVQEGTLRIGQILYAGKAWGKVKALSDWQGVKLKEAGPSVPVEVLGLGDVPMAGDVVHVVSTEKEAREITDKRIETERVKTLVAPKRKVSLRDLKRAFDGDEAQSLNLIVKADVQGSVEAVRGMLEKIKHAEVDIRILHSGVGAVTESDILLASAADAICVGFNVKPEPNARTAAERMKIEIRTYTIIYELVEDIENAIKGRLEPKFEEEEQGKVEIRAVFKLTRAGKVAGSHVVEGKITRNSQVRVRRGDEVVFTGKLASLKNVKQDVREMNAGQDCGLRFDGWEDFKEGDVVEAFEVVQVN
ncbi:MAG: translation initiation factor IF-2 [Fimbriimonadaceae bacterium]|nr:translation initiation factor IF-2 [Fimbriimonadaceae bacterium]